MAIRLKVQEQNIRLNADNDNVNFNLGDSVRVVQSGDYDDLTNRPQINGVTLTGNKTTEDLGIEAGVTSWNGETGDVVFNETDPTVPSWAKEENPPRYEFAYDESVSVGSAIVDEAVTGRPDYIPSGKVAQTLESVKIMTGAEATLLTSFVGVTLYINGINIATNTITKTVATSAPTFIGNGVKIAIKETE